MGPIQVIKRFIQFLFRPTESLFKATPSWFHDYADDINVAEQKLYRNYIYCCYRYGIRPHQYIKFDFYRLNHKARNEFVCDVKTNKICQRVNTFKNNSMNNCFDNKLLFDEVFKKEIGRDFIDTSFEREEVMTFLNNHSQIIVKPVNDHGGKGIQNIEVGDQDTEELTRILCKDKLLLEEIVQQCEEMTWLNKSSINTVRVVTIRDNSNIVRIIGCSLRVGREGMIVDNVSSGGIIYPLDVKRGYVCGKGINTYGQLFASHPDSGNLIIGFQVPRYEELLSFVKKAMDIIPKQRLVGWDVCIGSDSFYLIEGNLNPGAITFECDGIGKRELLRLALK